MNGSVLEAPAWLLALLLLPAWWWWLRRRDAAAGAQRRELLGPRADALATPVAGATRRRARACGAAGCALAVLALAGPRWGTVAAAVAPPAVDLVVCLDVSRSMRARDVAPSRLDAARQAIAALATAAAGDRLALVAFAGDARICVPLTSDAGSFAAILATTDELAAGRGGTDLGAALDAALGALVGGRAGGAIVLVTDGEDHGGRGLAAARRCAAQGIGVHCLGIGSVRGGKVPVAVGSGGSEAFLRDRSGDEVVTVLDERALQALAAGGAGAFARAGDATDATERLLALWRDHVRPGARAAATDGADADHDDPDRGPPRRYHLPLFAAAMCWLLQHWLRARAGAQ